MPQLEHREADLLDILEVCQELGLPRLQAACLEYLSLSLEASTVCPLLGEVEARISSTSDQHSAAFSSVRDTCMRFIERRAREVVRTESFLKLSKETVVCVVKSDKVGTFLSGQTVCGGQSHLACSGWWCCRVWICVCVCSCVLALLVFL